MATNDYAFVTRWRVPGSVEEVSDIFADTASLARWWSDVYLDVRILEPGDDGGLGRLVRLRTKGRLPYELRWTFRIVESRRPHGFTLQASGDFDGRGTWVFEQDGPYVNATFEWRVRADKPLLRSVSFLFKPLFAWNHRWAMARGEAGLRRELERRRRDSGGADL